MSILSTVPKGAAVEGINPNLLRNWYFNHAVNSRNVSTVSIPSATEYLIDGWTGTRIQFAYEDYGGYIAFYPNNPSYPTGYFTQWVDLDVVGKHVTISALLNSGKLITKTGILSAGDVLESDTVDNCKLWLRRQTSQTKTEFFIWATTLNQPATIRAAKLELGDQQTLCHQENGVWVLNEIPDYEEEYYRCVTSNADSSDTYANQKVSNITVQCNSVGSSSLRYYNKLIQSTHKVLDSTFSNLAAQTSDITVTTYDGYLDFSNGFASGATTNITLVLGTSGPVLSTSTTAPS